MLAIKGAIRGTSKKKIYNELGLDSPQNRKLYRKLSFLYKVIANQSPSCLLNLLGTKHNFVQNNYFPSAIKEWNRLDIDIQKSDGIILPAITCSMLIIETREQAVKYVQSFIACSSVSIVNFEHINAGWVVNSKNVS